MYNQVSAVYCELDFCRVLVDEAEIGAWNDLREEVICFCEGSALRRDKISESHERVGGN